MNKEIYHEGWLIKSPPTKRIWRARWRKRWFTLKQGEIPGQFCLEYYTDRNCRKLKGVIDLDQCEQVDSGLRLEHRKQKFQFMFDIKTPRRTYYLAADTENDMRDWVNCICQVCNLHDFTKQSNERQYYNVCDNNPSTSVIADSNTNASAEQQLEQHNVINENASSSASLNNSSVTSTNVSNLNNRIEKLSLNNTYQNNEFPYVNTDYSNRETIICDHSLQNDDDDNKSTTVGAKTYQSGAISTTETTNLLDRSQSFKHISKNGNNDDEITITPNHVRTQSLNETGTVIGTHQKKKIPENLVLSNTFVESSVEPSPALSTCSGPYIPISECFSGSPKMLNNDDVPCTPLNSLDPKFYDTPRSHNNIGLNLTNDQSYSPKIYNCPETQVKHRSGRSTPSDSESVFTDDEDWSHSVSLRENVDRNLRPSDSSVENDAIVFTYTQRFSKLPDGTQPDKSEVSDTTKISKRKNLILESTNNDEKQSDKPQLSDTENASPAIGPRDASSYVEESYDIPRSHHLPYYNLNSLEQQISPDNSSIALSTPDLIAETELAERKNSQTLPRPHFYTNAAPTKVEGNVFRYDFVEQSDVPPVNRKLKPKLSGENKPAADLPIKQTTRISAVPSTGIEIKSVTRPPSVDRKLKPVLLKRQDSPIGASTLRRPGIPASFIASTDSEFNVNHKELETRTLPRNMSTALSANNNNCSLEFISSSSSKSNNSQLQYFDLDTSNPPPPPQINRASTSSSLHQGIGSGTGNLLKLGTSLDSGVMRTPIKSGVVYNSVDFLKTEAFKRIREDAEKNRMKD